MKWTAAILLALSLLPSAPVAAAQTDGGKKWVVRFFHDEDDSEFHINDLTFPSAQRGIACGYLLMENGRIRPRVLVTSDGGDTWSFVETPQVGLSLFFLNDSLGWMVSDGVVWLTEESGRSWRRLARLRNVERVYFLSEMRGFAVGPRKSVYETRDGGETWDEVAAASEPKTDPDHTSYGWIEFQTPEIGSIVGWSRPPRRGRSRLPEWMDPEAAGRLRQVPTLSLVLQTTDGGETWKPSVTSMFGRIVRLRLRPDGTGLAVIWFDESFDYPSEVHLLGRDAKSSKRSFRAENRAVTDALLVGDRGYLAAIEPPGKIPQPIIPGRVVVLESDDLEKWTEMPVDYRAYAQRVVLAGTGENSIWLATDTGMILQLR